MELVDIVDENNKLTGQVEDRWVAYKKGMWRRVVSCWIMNKEGKILLQKRAKAKLKNPGKWAKTGGQIDTKETPDEAIQREVKEEIGIEVPKEQVKLVSIRKNGKPNRYFSYNYIFIVDYTIDDYTLQKEEVEKVKYFTIEEIEKAKKENNQNYTFAAWKIEEFTKEIEVLKKRRKDLKK